MHYSTQFHQVHQQLQGAARAAAPPPPRHAQAGSSFPRTSAAAPAIQTPAHSSRSASSRRAAASSRADVDSASAGAPSSVPRGEGLAARRRRLRHCGRGACKRSRGSKAHTGQPVTAVSVRPQPLTCCHKVHGRLAGLAAFACARRGRPGRPGRCRPRPERVVRRGHPAGRRRASPSQNARALARVSLFARFDAVQVVHRARQNRSGRGRPSGLCRRRSCVGRSSPSNRRQVR